MAFMLKRGGFLSAKKNLKAHYVLSTFLLSEIWNVHDISIDKYHIIGGYGIVATQKFCITAIPLQMCSTYVKVVRFTEQYTINLANKSRTYLVQHMWFLMTTHPPKGVNQALAKTVVCMQFGNNIPLKKKGKCKVCNKLYTR